MQRNIVLGDIAFLRACFADAESGVRCYGLALEHPAEPSGNGATAHPTGCQCEFHG